MGVVFRNRSGLESKDGHDHLYTPETVSEKTQTAHAQLKNPPQISLSVYFFFFSSVVQVSHV